MVYHSHLYQADWRPSMRRVAPVVLITLLFIPGCGNGDGLAVRPGAAVDLDPDDPSILMRPFTAEEIRDEWVPGFRLLMRRTFPEETRIERWTVVSADDDGVEIEYATIADDGSVEGEPSVSRSGWTELRDHAAFPAAHSTREWISRRGQRVLLRARAARSPRADAYPRR
jgi:hypothetical protein